MTDYQLEFGIPRGPQGPQGPMGATGPAGPQGPTGPQGPPGDVGAPPVFGSPQTGEPGTAVLLVGKGTAADPLILTVPKGAKGADGPRGPQGPQGEIGPAGPKGDKGATGATGPAGKSQANTFSIAASIGKNVPKSGVNSTRTDYPAYSDSSVMHDGLYGGSVLFGVGGTLTRSPKMADPTSGWTYFMPLDHVDITNTQWSQVLNTMKGTRSSVTVRMKLVDQNLRGIANSSGTDITTWVWDGSNLKPSGTAYAEAGATVYVASASVST